MLLPNYEDYSFWLCKSVDRVKSYLFYYEEGGVSFNPPIPSWANEEFKSDKF